MGFTDVTVVWEGAVSDQETFTDEQGEAGEYRAFIESVQRDAADTDDLVEIYELYHDHDLDIECECVQFVVDGRPSWTNER